MINYLHLFNPSRAAVTLAAGVCLAIATLASCGDGDDSGTQTSDRTQTPPPGTNFALLSDAFAADQAIPPRYTCDGEDISPGLSWGNVPEGTRFSILIMEDL